MNLHKYFGGRFQDYYEQPGDGGSGGVENVEVPSPSDDDIGTLSGDDGEGEDEDEDDASESASEGDEEGEEGESEEDKDKGKKGKKKEKDEDSFDVEPPEGEEKEEETEEETNEEETDEEKEKEAEDVEEKSIFKKLKTAYPDIYKKFPEVRTAIGEHRQFKNLFSNLEEAQETLDRADNFDKVSETLFSGNLETLFDEMETTEKGSSENLARNFLDTMRKRNKDLYLEVTEQPIKEFLYGVFSRTTDKNVKNSALHLWKQLTGKAETPSIEARREPSAREIEMEKRLESERRGRAVDADRSVKSSIYKQMRSRVESSLDPPDKDGKRHLSKVTREALVEHLMTKIDSEVAKDQNHMMRVNRLWQQAGRSSFSQGHLSRIIDAYLERAKNIVPKLVKQVREENGLKDDVKKKSASSERSNSEPPPRPSSGNNVQKKSLRDINPSKIDYSRTSDEDILAGRARLRR